MATEAVWALNHAASTGGYPWPSDVYAVAVELTRGSVWFSPCLALAVQGPWPLRPEDPCMGWNEDCGHR